MHKKSGRSRPTVVSSHLSSRPVTLEVICRHIGCVHQDHAKACFLHCSLKGLHETGLVFACVAISHQHSRHSMHSTAQHGAAQHNTSQHSTAQHSTAQHNTAQHRHRSWHDATCVENKTTAHMLHHCFSQVTGSGKPHLPHQLRNSTPSDKQCACEACCQMPPPRFPSPPPGNMP